MPRVWLVAAAVLCAMLVCGASTAMAQEGGVTIVVVVQFPPAATVGEQDVAASLRLENRSTGEYADDTFRVDQITLTPSCGSQLAFGICPVGGEEPGVFVPSAAGTGRSGTACAGRTFTITLLESIAGRFLFTADGQVDLGTAQTAGAICVIDFTFDVARAPAKDSDPAQTLPGPLQTAQYASVAVRDVTPGDTFGQVAVGVGSDETTVLRATPAVATAADDASITLGETFTDTATVTGASAGPSPTGTVSFFVYGPGDTNCTGTAVLSSPDRALTGGAATSGTFTPVAPGTYRVVADYGGDANYDAGSGGCNDTSATTVVAPAQAPPPAPPPVAPPPAAALPGGPIASPTPPTERAPSGSPPTQPPSPTTGPSAEPSPAVAPPDDLPPPGPPLGPDVAPPVPGAGSAARPEQDARGGRPRPAAKQPAAPRARAGAETTGAIGERSAPYDPRSEPEKTIALLVAAFTLMQLASSAGGLARSRERAAHGSTAGTPGKNVPSGGAGAAPSFDMGYEGLDVEFLGAGLGVVARGDRSRTWGWRGTQTLDRLSYALPARLSPRSPLLARVVADGTYLRAIFGSASLLGLLGGLALGVAAVQNTGGDALPPAAVLTIAIAVLGVFDAAAGLLAVLTFAIGVLVLGGVDTNAHLRVMLGLSALWVVVPLLAGAARPLRRAPTRGVAESWERAADFVIASLIGAWAVQSLVLALPGLAGLHLPIDEHANSAAYCVLAALVCRLGLETIAAHHYPQRLDVTEPAELPEPGSLQRILASALRAAIFIFFAYVLVGSSWQLWVGSALFFIPQVLAVFEDRLPSSATLSRALPTGLVELVLMLFVATVLAALLLATMDESSSDFLANSFVLLSLPGFVLSLLGLFGRERNERAIGWGKRIGGVGLLVAGILLSLGLLI